VGLLRSLKSAIAPSNQSTQTSSSRVSDDDIRQAKETYLPSLLASLGHTPQGQNGGRYTYLSPFRSENNPSFQVSFYEGKWTWKDWGTGDFGDTIAFAEKYYGIEFLDAVKILINKTDTPAASFPAPQKPPDVSLEKSDAEKIAWVRDTYRKCLTTTVREKVEEYFLRTKKVNFHLEMGSVIYTSLKEDLNYIAIPLPTPGRMIGLECRGLGHQKRKTYGKKVLWMLERDPSRVLVCESILDALAGEVLMQDGEISLASVNGVGNVELLEDYFQQLRPREVVFALDADEPGQTAMKRAIEIARTCDIKIKLIEEHKKAGVKDLHKLLLLKKGGEI
jgi:hypothetical protein